MSSGMWYVHFEDGMAGPVAWWELRLLAAKGLLTGQDKVSRDKIRAVPAGKLNWVGLVGPRALPRQTSGHARR